MATEIPIHKGKALVVGNAFVIAPSKRDNRTFLIFAPPTTQIRRPGLNTRNFSKEAGSSKKITSFPIRLGGRRGSEVIIDDQQTIIRVHREVRDGVPMFTIYREDDPEEIIPVSYKDTLDEAVAQLRDAVREDTSLQTSHSLREFEAQVLQLLQTATDQTPVEKQPEETAQPQRNIHRVGSILFEEQQAPPIPDFTEHAWGENESSESDQDWNYDAETLSRRRNRKNKRGK